MFWSFFTTIFINLKGAQHHNGMWQYVQNIIESKLNEDINTLYEKLNRKLTY
jgi:hypothetical protein